MVFTRISQKGFVFASRLSNAHRVSQFATQTLKINPSTAKSILLASSLTAALICGWKSSLAAEPASVPPTKIAKDAVAEKSVYIDPDTKVEMPRVMELLYADKDGRESLHKFSLVGLGVRQVTALYFNVYVAALYADEGSLAGIKHSPKWRSFTVNSLLQGTENGWFMKDFVRRPGTELTLVIRPVRPTTGTHLRQGFIRFLTAKLSQDFGTGANLSPGGQDAEAAIAEFSKNFPAGNVTTKQNLIFTKKTDGSLRVEFDFRTNVAQGLHTFVQGK
ncbi:hypothetical protein HDU67_007723 [Dinochytrium kinnereticum]|nr:hypothetical protein HDU67_007723 [Dinochytrium kinnereticum]